MTHPDPDPDPAEPDRTTAAAPSAPSTQSAPSAARLRRRLAEIFGDDPATTADERGDSGSADERETGSGADRWYSENRPPHHGG